MRDALSRAVSVDPHAACLLPFPVAAVEMRAQMARIIAAEVLDSIDRAGRAQP